MKNKQDLVYCNECIYLHKENNYKSFIELTCRHSDNTKVEKSFLKEERTYIKHPSKLNKNNDCKWYGSKYAE